ncbi:MAG: hypothetical protein WAQ08_02020 [Aquabacterium sp.]|jgi:hypothetical protein|uniref:hypothetical protein n=1 Tax=Aquabacterium sp. TaxID=1872578 RepID=UPI003BB0AA03
MSKYVFDSICRQFVDDYKAVADANSSPSDKNEHDKKVYAALMPSFNNVRKFYETYEKSLELFKQQAKHNMDAIENTLKKSKGKPSASELKLCKTSQGIINQVGDAYAKLGVQLKTEMMDWRGGWNSSCSAVVFNKKMLETMMGYRKEVIDKQAAQWNPTGERLEQYVIRAETLISAAAKATAQSESSASDDLDRLTAAHKECMAAGTKGLPSLMDTVNVDAGALKGEVKAGLSDSQRKDAAKLWKVLESKYAQYPAYAKSFSGAIKTLDMLKKSVETGAKSATKETAAAWKQLKTDIEANLKKLATAEKDVAECIKLSGKMAELYKKAIKG